MTGRNPTDRRGKRGTKRNVLTDQHGIQGYDFQKIEYEDAKRGYISHIRHRGEETLLAMTKKHNNHHPGRRWVVERTNSWHNNRFRKLLIRYEKKSENYLGLVHLSCCMILYRRIILG